MTAYGTFVCDACHLRHDCSQLKHYSDLHDPCTHTHLSVVFHRVRFQPLFCLT